MQLRNNKNESISGQRLFSPRSNLYSLDYIIDHNLNLLDTKWNGYLLYCCCQRTDDWFCQCYFMLSQRQYQIECREKQIGCTNEREKIKQWNSWLKKKFQSCCIATITSQSKYHLSYKYISICKWQTNRWLFAFRSSSFKLHSGLMSSINIRICIRSGTAATTITVDHHIQW